MTERIVREQERRWERYGRVTFDQEEALLYDIGAEMDKLVPGMASDLQWAMRDQTRLGITAGEQQLRNGLGVQFGGLNRDSTNEMVQRLTEGRPISSLMLGANEEYKKQLAAILLRRGVLGQNPRQAGSELRRVLGQQQGGTLARWLTVARTEMLDANRRGLGALYQRHSNVLRGKERMCTLDERTCLACVALDGMVYPLDAPEDEHQNGRCTWLPVLRHKFDEDRRGRRVKGHEWFAKLDPSIQRRMMGPKLHEAFTMKRVLLRDLAMRRDNPGWRSAYYPTSLRSALERARTRSTLEKLERTGQKLLRSVKDVKALEAAGGAAIWVLNPFGWRFAITKAMKLGTTILRSTAPDFLEAAHINETVRFIYHYLRQGRHAQAFDATSTWIRTQEAEELAERFRLLAEGRAFDTGERYTGSVRITDSFGNEIRVYTREQFEVWRRTLGEQLRSADPEDIISQAIETIRHEALARYGPQSLPAAEVAATLPALPIAALREAALRQARIVVEQMLRAAPGTALAALRSQFDIREDIRTAADLVAAVADFSLRRQTLALRPAFDDWDYWGEMAPALRTAAQVTPGQGYHILDENGRWNINNELVRATYEGKFEAIVRPDPPSGGVFISVVDQIAGGESRISVAGRTLWAEEGPSAEWVRNHTVNEIRQTLRGELGFDPTVHYRPAFRGGPTAKFFEFVDVTTGEVVRLVEVVSGHWTRSIGRTPSGFEVKHETLFISPEDFQGLGFAEQFNDQAFAHYITHFVVMIGISTTAVGSYTWAKTRGFQWSGEDRAIGIIDSKELEIRAAINAGYFTEDDLQRWLQQVVANQERGGMFSWELATLGQEKTWEITDASGIRRRMHFGKMVMLNSGWSGYIRVIPPTASTRWGFPYPRPPQLFPKYPMLQPTTRGPNAQRIPWRQVLGWNPEPFIRAAMLDAVRRSGEMDVPSILHGMLSIENEIHEGELLDRVNELVNEVHEGLNVDPGSLRLMDVIEEVVSFHYASPEAVADLGPAEWIADYLREVAYGVPEGLVFSAPRISPQQRQDQLRDRADAADRAVRMASILREEIRPHTVEQPPGTLDQWVENATGLAELYITSGLGMAEAIVRAMEVVITEPIGAFPEIELIQRLLAPQASPRVQSGMPPTQTVWSYPTQAQFGIYTEEDAMAIYAHVYGLSDSGDDFEGQDDDEVEEFLRNLWTRYVSGQIPELPVEVSTALYEVVEQAGEAVDNGWVEGVEREYRQGQSFGSALSGHEAEPFVMDWDVLSPLIDNHPTIQRFQQFLGAARPEPPTPTPIQVAPPPTFSREITSLISARIWEGEAVHFFMDGYPEPIATVFVVQQDLTPSLTRPIFNQVVDIVHENIEALGGWGALRDFPLYVVEPVSGEVYRWNGSQTVSVFYDQNETDVWTTGIEQPTPMDMLFNIVIEHNLVDVVLPRLANNIAYTLRDALYSAFSTALAASSGASWAASLAGHLDELLAQYEILATEVLAGERDLRVDEMVQYLAAHRTDQDTLVQNVIQNISDQFELGVDFQGVAQLVEAAGFTESDVRHIMESEGAVQYLPVAVRPPAPVPNPDLNRPPDRGMIYPEGLVFNDIVPTIRGAIFQPLADNLLIPQTLISPMVEAALFVISDRLAGTASFDEFLGRLEQHAFEATLIALQANTLDLPVTARNVAFEVWAAVSDQYERQRVRNLLGDEVVNGILVYHARDLGEVEVNEMAVAIVNNVLLPGVERTASELLEIFNLRPDVVANQVAQVLRNVDPPVSMLEDDIDRLGRRLIYRLIPDLERIRDQMIQLAPGATPVEPPAPAQGQTIMIPRFGQIFTIGQRYRVTREGVPNVTGVLAGWNDQGDLQFDDVNLPDSMSPGLNVGTIRVAISSLSEPPTPIGVGPTVVVSSTPTTAPDVDELQAVLGPEIMDVVQTVMNDWDDETAAAFVQDAIQSLIPSFPDDLMSWYHIWNDWLVNLQTGIENAMEEQVGFVALVEAGAGPIEDILVVLEHNLPLDPVIGALIERFRFEPARPSVTPVSATPEIPTITELRAVLDRMVQTAVRDVMGTQFYEDHIDNFVIQAVEPLLPDWGDMATLRDWYHLWNDWEANLQTGVENAMENAVGGDHVDRPSIDSILSNLRSLFRSTPITSGMIDRFVTEPPDPQARARPPVIPVNGSWVETEGWVRGALEEVARHTVTVPELQDDDGFVEIFTSNLLPMETGDDASWAAIWQARRDMVMDAIVDVLAGQQTDYDVDALIQTYVDALALDPVLRQLIELFDPGAPELGPPPVPIAQQLGVGPYAQPTPTVAPDVAEIQAVLGLEIANAARILEWDNDVVPPDFVQTVIGPLIPTAPDDLASWRNIWSDWMENLRTGLYNALEEQGFNPDHEETAEIVDDVMGLLESTLSHDPVISALIERLQVEPPLSPIAQIAQRLAGPAVPGAVTGDRREPMMIQDALMEFLEELGVPAEWLAEAQVVANLTSILSRITGDDARSIIEDYLRARRNGVPVQTAGADAFSRAYVLAGRDIAGEEYQRGLINFIQDLQSQIVGGQRFGPRSISRPQTEVEEELIRLGQVERPPELDNNAGKIAKLRSAIKDNLASGRPPYRQDLEELANLTGKDPYTLLRQILHEFEQPVDAATLRSFLERQRAAGGSLPVDDPYVRWLAQLENTSQPEIIREVADAVPEQQDRPQPTWTVRQMLEDLTASLFQWMVDEDPTFDQGETLQEFVAAVLDVDPQTPGELAEIYIDYLEGHYGFDSLDILVDRNGQPWQAWLLIELTRIWRQEPPPRVGAPPSPTPPPLPPAGQQLDNERMASALEDAIRRELPAWGLSPDEINDTVEAALDFFGSELDDPEAYAGINDLLDQAASWIDSIVPLAGAAGVAATNNIVARWLELLAESGQHLMIPDDLAGLPEADMRPAFPDRELEPLLEQERQRMLGLEQQRIDQDMEQLAVEATDDPTHPWQVDLFDQNDQVINTYLEVGRVLENLGWPLRFEIITPDEILMDLPVIAQRRIFEHMQASNQTTGFIHVDFTDPETGITIQVAVPMDSLELFNELGVLAGNGRYINLQEPYPPNPGEWIYLDAVAEGEEVAPVGQGDIGRVTGFDPDTDFVTVDWLNDATYSLKWQQDSIRRLGFRQRMISGSTDWEIVENASAGIDPERIVHSEIKRDDHVVWIWYALDDPGDMHM